ncbi:MAG: hypothetical protein J1D88_07680 [Treponema sp.]|nr:hypothetical protein [Treponema sp.]
MSFFQSIAEFLQSIFMASSPEVKKRQAIKKIELELRDIQPSLYKNSMVQVNFAEALRMMFACTKPIENLLSETIFSEDIEHNHKYEEQLLLTGFPQEVQEMLESLSFEHRKAEALQAKSLTRHFDAEHRTLEKIIKELNSKDLIKIDNVLDRIKQLSDICRFGYVNAIRMFDINFLSRPEYEPQFQSIPPDLIESTLQDLYYVCAGMDISSSVGNAILALAQLKNLGTLDEKTKSDILLNLKKIQGLLRHVFTEPTLLKLVRVAKKDPDFVPPKAKYQVNARKNYARYLEMRFTVDEGRLKVEIQDENLRNQVHEVFGDRQLDLISGYNSTLNNQLRQSTPNSFVWITPLQILKSFFNVFYSEPIRALLNNIVIEGFFNDPDYKTKFSSMVYACNESLDRILKFEQLFSRTNEFDESLIVGLIRDSHKDDSFAGKLKDLVEKINKRAKEVIQFEASNVNQLYGAVGEILADCKKPSSDVISNLKVLMISSRNRDSAETLERQYPQWKIFLEIMKNYVIIGNAEKKNP